MSNLNFNPKRSQNDVVDNFAFISVLTDSLFSSLLQTYFIPDFTNSQHSVTFFLHSENCQRHLHTEHVNFHFSALLLCTYDFSSSKFGYPEIHQKISALNRNDREITSYVLCFNKNRFNRFNLNPVFSVPDHGLRTPRQSFFSKI